MNKDDLNKLLESGMYIGSHSHNHFWLSTLNYQDQENEIEDYYCVFKKYDTKEVEMTDVKF